MDINENGCLALLAGAGVVVVLVAFWSAPEVTGGLLSAVAAALAVYAVQESRRDQSAAREAAARRVATDPYDRGLSDYSSEVGFHRWQRERIFEDEVKALIGFNEKVTNLVVRHLVLLYRRSMEIDEKMALEFAKSPRFELEESFSQAVEAYGNLFIHSAHNAELVNSASNLLTLIGEAMEDIDSELAELEDCATAIIEADRDIEEAVREGDQEALAELQRLQATNMQDLVASARTVDEELDPHLEPIAEALNRTAELIATYIATSRGMDPRRIAFPAYMPITEVGSEEE